jgi:hypothetical protein
MAVQLKERALADLTKIDATIARLEEQLRKAREDRVKLQHFLEVADRYAREQDDEQEGANSAGRRWSKAARLREMAHAFLSQARAPVPIGELAQHVVEQGENIPGADKGSYLSSVLARDERFQNIRNAGWLLAGAAWANMEAGAEPEPIQEHQPEPEEEAQEPEPGPDFDPQPEWKPTPPPSGQYRRVARPTVVDELDDDIPF